MRCVDVNVLVDAHRADSPTHAAVSAWLHAARLSPEPLGVPALTASGFLRVVTHPRVFADPTPTNDALEFLRTLRSGDNIVWVTPGPRHWSIFEGLCADLSLRGNLAPDAYLAAMALELGATWVTSDRGFSRYPDLRLEIPAHPHPPAR